MRVLLLFCQVQCINIKWTKNTCMTNTSSIALITDAITVIQFSKQICILKTRFTFDRFSRLSLSQSLLACVDKSLRRAWLGGVVMSRKRENAVRNVHAGNLAYASQVFIDPVNIKQTAGKYLCYICADLILYNLFSTKLLVIKWYKLSETNVAWFTV